MMIYNWYYCWREEKKERRWEKMTIIWNYMWERKGRTFGRALNAVLRLGIWGSPAASFRIFRIKCFILIYLFEKVIIIIKNEWTKCKMKGVWFVVATILRIQYVEILLLLPLHVIFHLFFLSFSIWKNQKVW